MTRRQVSGGGQERQIPRFGTPRPEHTADNRIPPIVPAGESAFS